jgi:hypothetical protein
MENIYKQVSMKRQEFINKVGQILQQESVNNNLRHNFVENNNINN